MNKHKFGVSFNIFDAEYLLLSSIKQIRPYVDFVSVIYQQTSNYENKCDPDLVPFLEYLKEQKLVDQIEEFIPTNFGHSFCHRNELAKRERGQVLSHFAGCTNHLFADSDEMWDSEQFKKAVEKIREYDYDATYAHIQDYGVIPTKQAIGLANYYVPFFNKISTRLSLGFRGYAYCDPCRSVADYLFPHIFPENELIMHHMTKTRIDKDALKVKYLNSSARQNFKNIDQMIADSYLEANDETKYMNVPDQFNIIQTFDDYRQWKNNQLTSSSNSVTI